MFEGGFDIPRLHTQHRTLIDCMTVEKMKNAV
jgi:hypothetical protein